MPRSSLEKISLLLGSWEGFCAGGVVWAFGLRAQREQRWSCLEEMLNFLCPPGCRDCSTDSLAARQAEGGGQVINAVVNHREVTQGCKGLGNICLSELKQVTGGKSWLLPFPGFPLPLRGLAFCTGGCSDLLMLYVALLV